MLGCVVALLACQEGKEANIELQSRDPLRKLGMDIQSNKDNNHFNIFMKQGAKLQFGRPTSRMFQTLEVDRIIFLQRSTTITTYFVR